MIRNQDKDEQLFILLDSGCPADEDENKKYCNFLLEIKDLNGSDEVVKERANDMYTAMNCNLSYACSYCFKPHPAPGQPPSNICININPPSCPTESNVDQQKKDETSQNGTISMNMPLIRRKRQNTNSKPLPSVDFDSDGRFMKKLMDIKPKYR